VTDKDSCSSIMMARLMSIEVKSLKQLTLASLLSYPSFEGNFQLYHEMTSDCSDEVNERVSNAFKIYYQINGFL
ncbi:hypothetical protein, partial [Gimesia aquarii]|uniref:hypothetical protein n=1 Tax=Gimesia aquarii TaxID=2527964 RepID=UPI001E52E341